MEKIQKQAVFCCVLSLVFSLATGLMGFYLLALPEGAAIGRGFAFVFRFFCMVTPTFLLITLITVARMKK